MNQIIKTESVNFHELIKKNTTLTLNCETKMLNLLNTAFTEEQSRWYIANLFMYINYHPTNDFPINLEHVVKIVGFAHKKNAKRTLENNFTIDEDYKLIKLPREQKQNAGRCEEEIMLNIECFKNLCMIAKTPQGKEIRKYYVKLENINNEIIKEQLEEQKLIQENTVKQLEEQKLIQENTIKQLEENKQQLLEKEQLLEQLENKPELEGFIRQDGYIYLIKDITKPGHYKIGFAGNPDKRLSQLNTGSSTYALQIISRFKTFDKIYAEKMIHYALFPFKMTKSKEWFYLLNDLELAYTIKTIKDCINSIEKYNIKDLVSFKQINIDIQTELLEINNEINLQEQTIIDKIELHNKICTLQGQQMNNKTGHYKGVHWKDDKQKWTASLKKDYNNIFLGYFNSEEDGAKAYNDYALFLNNNENTNYLLNVIPNYTSIPRNLPIENKENKELEFTSKYIGVSYNKERKYFQVSIKLNSKTYHLDNYENEIEAAKIYNQQALYFNETLKTNYILNDIENYITIAKNIYEELQNKKKQNKSSQYYGVSFHKIKKKYHSYLVYNKKQINLGYFDDELDAAKAYNTKVEELNKNFNKKYKLNQLE